MERLRTVGDADFLRVFNVKNGLNSIKQTSFPLKSSFLPLWFMFANIATIICVLYINCCKSVVIVSMKNASKLCCDLKMKDQKWLGIATFTSAENFYSFWICIILRNVYLIFQTLLFSKCGETKMITYNYILAFVQIVTISWCLLV